MTTGLARILLIDDDVEYHEIFGDYLDLALSNGAYHLTCYADTAKALDALREQPFTAVFVDYRMGADSGIDFIHNCSVAGVSAPFILLTGYDSLEAEKEALAIGAFDYVSKDDVKPTVLSRCIRHAANTLEREEELRAALRQAQIGIEVREQFLGNMSHEMRTPLNGIIGFSEILLMQAEGKDSKVESYAKYIHESGRRLLELVEGLLTLAEQSGTRKEDIQPTDLPVLVSQLCTRYQTQAEARRIGFSVRNEYSGGRLLVDPELLSVALRPILDNAVKFTEAEDRVTVTIAVGVDLKIAVQDTGSGMTREILAEAAAPFVQSESHLSRRYGGAGIGLSIARNAVAALGGSMIIDSTPGKGTCVCITIPVKAFAEKGHASGVS